MASCLGYWEDSSREENIVIAGIRRLGDDTGHAGNEIKSAGLPSRRLPSAFYSVAGC